MSSTTPPPITMDDTQCLDISASIRLDLLRLWGHDIRALNPPVLPNVTLFSKDTRQQQRLQQQVQQIWEQQKRIQQEAQREIKQLIQTARITALVVCSFCLAGGFSPPPPPPTHPVDEHARHDSPCTCQAQFTLGNVQTHTAIPEPEQPTTERQHAQESEGEGGPDKTSPITATSTCTSISPRPITSQSSSFPPYCSCSVPSPTPCVVLGTWVTFVMFRSESRWQVKDYENEYFSRYQRVYSEHDKHWKHSPPEGPGPGTGQGKRKKDQAYWIIPAAELPLTDMTCQSTPINRLQSGKLVNSTGPCYYRRVVTLVCCGEECPCVEASTDPDFQACQDIRWRLQLGWMNDEQLITLLARIKLQIWKHQQRILKQIQQTTTTPQLQPPQEPEQKTTSQQQQQATTSSITCHINSPREQTRDVPPVPDWAMIYLPPEKLLNEYISMGHDLMSDLPADEHTSHGSAVVSVGVVAVPAIPVPVVVSGVVPLSCCVALLDRLMHPYAPSRHSYFNAPVNSTNPQGPNYCPYYLQTLARVHETPKITNTTIIHTNTITQIQTQTQTHDPSPVVNVEGCPNRWNQFHQCTHYCQQRWGQEQQQHQDKDEDKGDTQEQQQQQDKGENKGDTPEQTPLIHTTMQRTINQPMDLCLNNIRSICTSSLSRLTLSSWELECLGPALVYSNALACVTDIRRVFHNAIIYHDKTSWVYQAAVECLMVVENDWWHSPSVV